MHRARLLIRQVLAGLLLLLAANGAAAHEVRPALAEVIFDAGRYEIVFTANLEALIVGVGPSHQDTDQSPEASEYNRLRALDGAALRAAFERFAPQFLAGLRIEVDGAPAEKAVLDVDAPDAGDVDLARDSRVRVGGALPRGAESLTFAWAPDFGAVVFRTGVDENGEGYSGYLIGGAPSEPVPVTGGAAQGAMAVFADYLFVGFDHIVPKGLDHILFVIGLFLLSTRLRPLLIQITAFTLAHTVTLALGIFGVATVSPAIVEPLIAASIVYVAVENIFLDRLSPWRPALVFAFGLLHGLGFAGVLVEFGLPAGQYVPALIAFNIGVEIGQLFVVGVCFLLVGAWFGSKSWYRAYVVIPGSLLIAAIGAYWVVERTLL